MYAQKNEDIKGIYEKIKFVGDFVHIDIVDKTFNVNAPDPSTYRLEVVKAYWPTKEIHCHIMSKNPSEWINKVFPFVDTILVHTRSMSDEEIFRNIELIKSYEKKIELLVFL